jgi:phosphate uptake regulator
METRKIQLTGGSTYTVSLPKEWASDHEIEAGTQVDLFPHIDGSLVLRASQRQNEESSKIQIDATQLTERNLIRVVQASYMAGYDVIRLVASTEFSSRDRRAVRTTAQNLIGLEPVQETETEVVLKSLLDASDVSIRQSLVQLQYTAVSMHEDATEAVVSRDDDLARQVQDRDDEADRLFGMIERHFQRALTDLEEIDALEVSRPTLFDYYTTARQLERVADHAVKIAMIASHLEETLLSELQDDLAPLANQSRDIVKDATSVLLEDATVTTAYETLEICDDVTDDITALDRALYEDGTSGGYHLTLVLDSLIRTAEYGGNIAETAIRVAARNGQL